LLGTKLNNTFKPNLANLYPTGTADHLRQLVDPFTLDEVKQAIHDLPKDKASGPDDFPIEFL
jgi:hypothetical protein